MMSVCVYENTCPTWSEPLTVGGGVSIEKTRSLGKPGSKEYVFDSSHTSAHLLSIPTNEGLESKESLRSLTPKGFPPDEPILTVFVSIH